ncbi:MAG: hypothetical protein HY400_02325 [Elusimicrobia bacterium]|nr:hypothetical protein [Elusimicrobiota bacterium]
MTKTIAISGWWLVVGVAAALGQEAGTIQKSTATLIGDWTNVAKVYTTDKMRDPFIPLTGAGVQSASIPTEEPDINIHELRLKGMMKDAKGKTAILISSSGFSYILKGGKLWNRKGKPVPGITGLVQGKAVFLSTADKDIQWLKMGEE